MALTTSGVEFYLADVRAVAAGVDLKAVLELMRSNLREGDAVFSSGGRVVMAIASDVQGAGTAIRRMMKATREGGIPVRIRLIAEPFPPELKEAADKVIHGAIKIHFRPRKPT